MNLDAVAREIDAYEAEGERNYDLPLTDARELVRLARLGRFIEPFVDDPHVIAHVDDVWPRPLHAMRDRFDRR